MTRSTVSATAELLVPQVGLELSLQGMNDLWSENSSTQGGGLPCARLHLLIHSTLKSAQAPKSFSASVIPCLIVYFSSILLYQTRGEADSGSHPAIQLDEFYVIKTQ